MWLGTKMTSGYVLGWQWVLLPPEALCSLRESIPNNRSTVGLSFGATLSVTPKPDRRIVGTSMPPNLEHCIRHGRALVAFGIQKSGT
jgi:hypothetical protein